MGLDLRKKQTRWSCCLFVKCKTLFFSLGTSDRMGSPLDHTSYLVKIGSSTTINLPLHNNQLILKYIWRNGLFEGGKLKALD